MLFDESPEPRRPSVILYVLDALRAEQMSVYGYARETTYQDEVRIPLIFFQPGRLAPETIPEPVQGIDLMPTLLSYAGIDFDPLPLQGRDILDRETRKKPRRIFLSRRERGGEAAAQRQRIRRGAAPIAPRFPPRIPPPARRLPAISLWAQPFSRRPR